VRRERSYPPECRDSHRAQKCDSDQTPREVALAPSLEHGYRSDNKQGNKNPCENFKPHIVFSHVAFRPMIPEILISWSFGFKAQLLFRRNAQKILRSSRYSLKISLTASRIGLRLTSVRGAILGLNSGSRRHQQTVSCTSVAGNGSHFGCRQLHGEDAFSAP
jgi:hypothetical protein